MRMYGESLSIKMIWICNLRLSEIYEVKELNNQLHPKCIYPTIKTSLINMDVRNNVPDTIIIKLVIIPKIYTSFTIPNLKLDLKISTVFSPYQVKLFFQM